MAQLGNKHKPLLVFLPGTLCTKEVFRQCEKKIDSPVVSVQFDTQSSVMEMATKIKNEIGEQSIILVGFSMGGMAAFEFIRTYPHQVKGLILLNSNSHSDLPGRKSGRDAHLELAIEQGLEHLMTQVYLPIYFSNSHVPEAKLVVKMAVQCGVDSFKAQLNILANRPDSTATLQSFIKPVLIIGSEQDVPCPPAHQREMATATVQSELHIIKEAGHFALIEKPNEIAQIINIWLENNYE